MTPKLAVRLARALEKSGKKQADLARALGVTAQAVNGWLKTGRISKEMLPRFAKETGVSVEELLTGRNNVSNPSGVNYRKVPLISWVQAGSKNSVFDPYPPGAPEEWENATVTLSNDSFALIVRGDSMVSPDGTGFPEGTIIFVDPAVEAKSGDYVVVRFNDSDEATFKRLIIDGPSKFLRALNPAYPAIPITKDARIAGKVVESNMRRKFG